ncbi:MAG: hypothetical protein E2O84_06770 [Bacteroidetes bacterium]|nr:MAG: hypothetical protein E2O84_06770 [Bacteroidota bacterium]
MRKDQSANEVSAWGLEGSDSFAGPLTRDLASAASGIPALDIIKPRAKNAGLPDWIGNHVCRATGITRFLEAGGTLEEAANLANHADMRTTRIYDKRDLAIRRTSVERIVY